MICLRCNAFPVSICWPISNDPKSRAPLPFADQVKTSRTVELEWQRPSSLSVFKVGPVLPSVKHPTRPCIFPFLEMHWMKGTYNFWSFDFCENANSKSAGFLDFFVEPTDLHNLDSNPKKKNIYIYIYTYIYILYIYISK